MSIDEIVKNIHVQLKDEGIEVDPEYIKSVISKG